MKLSASSIRNSIHAAKNHIIGGYHQAVRVAGHIHDGVNTGRRIYAALSPIIDAVAPSLHGRASKALTNYAQARERVMSLHDQGKEIAGNVQQAAPQLFL